MGNWSNYGRWRHSKTWLLWTRKEKRKKKILSIFNQCINSIHQKKPG